MPFHPKRLVLAAACAAAFPALVSAQTPDAVLKELQALKARVE